MACKYSFNKKINETRGSNDENAGINEPWNGTIGFTVSRQVRTDYSPSISKDLYTAAEIVVDR